MEPNIISWSQIRKEFMLREESGCAEKTEDLHLPRMFVYKFLCFWIKAPVNVSGTLHFKKILGAENFG